VYRCPHCGEQALSAWRKLFLGQVGPAACRSCGGRVVASAWGLALLLPLVAASALASFCFESLGPFGAGVLVGGAILAALALHLEAVPLVAHRPSRTVRLAALVGLSALLAVPAAGLPLGLAAARYLPPPASLPAERRTGHFEIHTDLGPAELDHHARFLEGFVECFQARYFPVRQRRRLRVFLFADAAGYEAWVRPRYATCSPYGFYLRRSNVVVANLGSGLGTVTHELVHHFVAVSFAEPPPKWINEGFAAFFEKFIAGLDADGRLELSLGYFHDRRFPEVKRNVERLKLAELAAAPDPDQSTARSLALFLHRRGRLADLVNRARVARGAGDGLGLLEAACGKPTAEVEREWKDFLRAQPVDADVLLVEQSACMQREEWAAWQEANRERLYWDPELGIYRVRPGAGAE